MKNPDANYNDPILKKQGFLSRLFRRKPKDDPLTPTIPQYTRQEMALIDADRKRRAQEDAIVKQVAKKGVARQTEVKVDTNAGLYETQMNEDAQQFVDHGFDTPSHLVRQPIESITPQAIEQAAQIHQQAIPVVVTQSKLNKFINVGITAFAFIIGMVGVNIVYNQLPTYPMVTVGIVAIAVSAGIVTNMAR